LRLRSAAARLPGVCSGIAFECHLDGGRVDLISRLTRTDGRVLTRAPTGQLDHKALNVLRRWEDPHDLMYQVPVIDLEVDITDECRPPFLCPSIEPAFYGGLAAVIKYRQRSLQSDNRHLASTVLEAVLGHPLEPAATSGLERAFDALGEDGFIHYGQPRAVRDGVDAIRVIVSLPRYRTTDYLRTLGWDGDLALFERRCDLVGAYMDRIDLDLDLFPAGPGPRVALYAGFVYPNEYDASFQHLLRVMRDQACATATQTEALERHFAASRAAQDGERRAIQFKFCWDQDPRLRAKAYLGFDLVRPHSAPRDWA
jgi:hypothetical protein